MSVNTQTCPFCEIVMRDDPDVREVARDDRAVIFFPTEPATLGHTLIVPREHVEDIWALEPALAAHLGALTVSVAAAVRRAMSPEGLNVIQSNGAAASQTVPHLHIHVVPRWTGDAIGRIWPPETKYTENEKDQAWISIREECAALTS